MMDSLRVTLIDVGWGDSILLESIGKTPTDSHYALIDSNDTSTLRSSHIFLKRFFEKKGVTIPTSIPMFDWVLLTHAHADHGQGLKKILRDFGTLCFWYTNSANRPAFLADLLRYAARSKSTRVGQHDVVDTGKILPPFGPASMQLLWPNPGGVSANENDNSAVLAITLGNVCFVLTGDAEADGVWTQIAAQSSPQIPANTGFFKVPHHGSKNGTLTTAQTTPWLTAIPKTCKVAISSHVRPFQHPDPSVVTALASLNPIYRTDEHYHVTVATDGNKVDVSYSHV